MAFWGKIIEINFRFFSTVYYYAQPVSCDAKNRPHSASEPRNAVIARRASASEVAFDSDAEAELCKSF